MKTIKLKDLKRGDTFKRKPNAIFSYTRGKYYKGNFFDPTGYECPCDDDWCRYLYLKGDTTVYIDKPKKVIVRTIGTDKQSKIDVTGGFVNIG